MPPSPSTTSTSPASRPVIYRRPPCRCYGTENFVPECAENMLENRKLDYGSAWGWQPFAVGGLDSSTVHLTVADGGGTSGPALQVLGRTEDIHQGVGQRIENSDGGCWDGTNYYLYVSVDVLLYDESTGGGHHLLRPPPTPIMSRAVPPCHCRYRPRDAQRTLREVRIRPRPQGSGIVGVRSVQQ